MKSTFKEVERSQQLWFVCIKGPKHYCCSQNQYRHKKDADKNIMDVLVFSKSIALAFACSMIVLRFGKLGSKPAQAQIFV